MTDYRINVVIDPSSAKTGVAAVTQELQKAGGEAEKLRGLIQGALSFIGIGFGIKSIVDLADAYTSASNRVRVVTSSHAELQVVMDKLFQTADKTGVKLESTINTYQRVALAGKNLGLSQKDFIDITRGLTESAAISGTGTQKMAFGLQEVAQSMGQATVRGREIRAVINDIPYAAIAIVNELNRVNPALHYTTASLKELATQGLITPKLIADAFRGAGLAEIDEQFNKISPTIGRAIESLRTNLVKFIGDLNNSSGIQGTFASGILAIARNLEEIARYAAIAGGVLAVKFVAEGIRVAIVGLAEFGVALALNPLTAFLTLLGAAAGLLVGFGDQFTVATGHIATWQDFAISAFNDVGAALNGWISQGLTMWDNWYKGAENANSNIKLSFKDLVRGVAAFTDEMYVQYVYYRSRVTNLFVPGSEQDGKVTKEDLRQSLTDTNGGTLGVVDNIISQGDKRAGDRARISKIQQDAYNNALLHLGDHGPAIGTPAEGDISDYQKIINKLQGQVNVGVQQPGQDYFVNSELAKYQTEMKNKQETMTPGQSDYVKELLGQVYQLKELDKVYQQVDKSQETFAETSSALNELLATGKITTEQYSQEFLKYKTAADQANNSLGGGFSTGLDEIALKFKDINSLIAGTMVDAFTNAENALVKFTQTGKINFTQMITSMANDLARLVVRQEITAPIATAIGNLMKPAGAAEGGGAGSPTLAGGAMSAIGSLFSFGKSFFADGDIFSGGTPIGFSNGNMNIAGEAGPEGVLPLRRTSSGALGVVSSGAGGGVNNLSNSIVVNMNGSASGGGGDNGQAANRIALEVQKKLEQSQAEFVRKAQRTGGIMDGNKSTSIQ